MTRRRFDLTDHEWSIMQPLLPQKVRGVPRVDDRRVINGILYRFRTGCSWADIPERYGPHKTCYNRFVRWQKAGHWARILHALSVAYDDLVMIASTLMRVHQHGATASKKGGPKIMAWDVPGAG
tara:strand:- start:190 stop:561 length:372 start_codon:yes stop_codon:yes gene_type:complete